MSTPRTHVVSAGETPASIAAKYTGRGAVSPRAVRSLVQANPQKASTTTDGVTTFTNLVEGEVLTLPNVWSAVAGGFEILALAGAPADRRARVGVGDAPQANGLPDSSDIIAEGVSAGVGWLAGILHIQGGTVAEVADALVTVPAEAFAGYIAGMGAAVVATDVVTGVAEVLALVAPEAAGSLMVTVGVVAASLPVVGEVLGVVAAVIAIVSLIETPPLLTTEGPGGPVTMYVSDYVNRNIPNAANGAPAGVTMSVDDFAVAWTISVNDLLIGPLNTLIWVNGSYAGNPMAGFTIVPGAQSILHAAQLSAASAAAPLAAHIMSLYTGFTGPAALPLVTAAEWTQIETAAQPIHDAIVASAQNWADSQVPAPTDAAINQKYGLLPADRAAILAAWAPPPAPPPPAPILSGSSPIQKHAAPASGSAGTVVLVAGTVAAAAVWATAAYKGVSVASQIHSWYQRASAVLKRR